MSRPTSYTPELGAAVCERLAELGSLRAVCREDGMPDRNTVMRWVTDDIDGFAARYARAKDLGIDEFVDETIEIADDGSNDYRTVERGGREVEELDTEHVQRSKLRIETRRWLAERMAPKRYGNLSKLEVTGADGGPVLVDSTKRAARLAALVAAAQQRAAAGDVEDLV